MAKLYVRKGIHFQEKDFGIFELLTSELQGYIEGVRFGEQVVRTAFAGMKYPYLDSCPFKNFISDEEQDKVANILVPDKKIIVLPYKHKGKRPNLFYDLAKAAAKGRFLFDGTLQDALKEFHDNGFTFDIGRNPDGLHELEEILAMKQKGVPPEKRFIITAENVSLDKVFS